jgi:hypothetical protein
MADRFRLKTLLTAGVVLAALGASAAGAQTRWYNSDLWVADQVQTPDGEVCTLAVGLGNINGPTVFSFLGVVLTRLSCSPTRTIDWSVIPW